MSSKFQKFGASDFKGKINLALHYKDGVMVALDTRGRHPISKHIVSDSVQKFHKIGDIFMTMCGTQSAILKVWEAIEHEFEKNNTDGNITTAEMAADVAVDFMTSEEDIKRCGLYLVGKNKAGEIEIWLVESHHRKDLLTQGGTSTTKKVVKDPSKTRIEKWSIFGSGSNSKCIKDLMAGHNVSMSKGEALNMANKTVLEATLQFEGVGGHIVVHTISSINVELVTCLPIPKILVRYYDHVKALDAHSIFILTRNHVTDSSVSEFFRSGKVIPPVETWLVHTLGPVRGYNIRRVVFKNNVAAEVCDHVSRVWKSYGVANPSTDSQIKNLPFLFFTEGSLFYFTEQSKAMLKKLCFDPGL